MQTTQTLRPFTVSIPELIANNYFGDQEPNDEFVTAWIAGMYQAANADGVQFTASRNQLTGGYLIDIEGLDRFGEDPQDSPEAAWFERFSAVAMDLAIRMDKIRAEFVLGGICGI